jgi:hypothetical protein
MCFKNFIFIIFQLFICERVSRSRYCSQKNTNYDIKKQTNKDFLLDSLALNTKGTDKSNVILFECL